MASAARRINLNTALNANIACQRDAGFDLLSKGVHLLLAQFAAETSQSTTRQPFEAEFDLPDGSSCFTSTKAMPVKYSGTSSRITST